MAILTLCVCGTKHPRNEKCPNCKHGRKRSHGKTTKERGYGHDWRKLSKQVAAEQPLCPDCLEEQGRAIPGESRHHMQKIVDRPDLRLVRENVVNLCNYHHAIREREGR